MSLAWLLNAVIVLVGLALLAVGWVLVRGPVRQAPTCPRCRYDMSGLGAPPVTCPECGRTMRRARALRRRDRRLRWLPLMLAGVALTLEPLVVGSVVAVYRRLPDAALVHLYAVWNDPHAVAAVADRIGVFASRTEPFTPADLRTLARGAIARIERAVAERGPGPVEVDLIDLRILWLHDISTSDAAHSARVARAMPYLFAHDDPVVRFNAAILACDRHDPPATTPVALAAAADSDWRVREAGSVALFTQLRRGQPVAHAFVSLLSDQHPSVRERTAMSLTRAVCYASVPESLGPALEGVRPVDAMIARARALGLMASLRGEALVEACERLLRDTSDDAIRWATLRFVVRRKPLVERLLPGAPTDRGEGYLPMWLESQRRKPIDQVLAEQGFR